MLCCVRPSLRSKRFRASSLRKLEREQRRLCQTNAKPGYVHTLYLSFCLHEIRKWCQIKTDHFLVVIDFKVSLINRSWYCNLRGWRRKGRGGEGRGGRGKWRRNFNFQFFGQFLSCSQMLFLISKNIVQGTIFSQFFFKNNVVCSEISTQSIFSLKLSLPQGNTHNWLTCVAWKFWRVHDWAAHSQKRAMLRRLIVSHTTDFLPR